MISKQNQQSTVGNVFQKIASKIGAIVIMEPNWEWVGQIIFKSGRRCYFAGASLDINPLGSSKIASDKDFSSFFIKNLGYPVVPDSQTFFSKVWGDKIGCRNRNIDAAYRYAKKIGFPVIVKPNDGSQGWGVVMAHNKKELYKSIEHIFSLHQIVLIQKPVYGNDYRIVVLDNKIISAYQRIPLSIIGNGKSTILKLLKLKQKQHISNGCNLKIRFDDSRIATKLHHQGLTLDSIPANNVRIYLLDNANLSTGGDSIDFTKKLHPSFKKIAIKLVKDMGLRLCGVDMIIAGDISDKPQTYWVLEINSSPSVSHYAKIGRAQKKIVEKMYIKILKHLDR